jgi:hypothetical protein
MECNLVAHRAEPLEFRGFAMNEQPPHDPDPNQSTAVTPQPKPTAPLEIGGRPGPDPTRYGDWEKDGRCIDF